MHPQLHAIVDDFELAGEASPSARGGTVSSRRGATVGSHALAIAEGVLGRLWIISPFDARIRYNAYACLTFFRATSLVTRGRRNRCGAGHRTG